MKRKKAFIGFLSVVICLAAVAVGCQSKPAAVESPKQPVQQEQPTVSTAPQTQTSSGPQEAEHTVPAPATPLPNNEKVSLASAEGKAEQPSATPGSGKSGAAGTKPKIEIESPYTQAKPTLLGLSLKTNASVILSKFGKPKDEFVMDDDADPMTVYDYDDFLIGFNTKQELHFIDVRSSDVDPGLNGLRLGDPAADINKALGKPTQSSSYVMTYKASGAILKLDIDPKTQKVNSIKLFAE